MRWACSGCHSYSKISAGSLLHRAKPRSAPENQYARLDEYRRLLGKRWIRRSSGTKAIPAWPLQHVGLLVGQHAHQSLWPTLIRWVQTHAG
jgi:hypothetical protein